MAIKEAGTGLMIIVSAALSPPLSGRIIVTVESEGNKMEEKHSVGAMWREFVKRIGKAKPNALLKPRR